MDAERTRQGESFVTLFTAERSLIAMPTHVLGKGLGCPQLGAAMFAEEAPVHGMAVAPVLCQFSGRVDLLPTVTQEYGRAHEVSVTGVASLGVTAGV